MLNNEHHHLQNKFSKRRILIVDGNQDFVKNLVDILEPLKYKIETAYSSNEALEKIKEFDAQIALVDLKLPDGSGLDVISKLRQERHSCSCVIITANADMDSAIAALEEGVFDYLPKPINPLELIKLLDRAFETIHLRDEKERALEDLELFKYLLNQSNDAIFVIDAETSCFLDFNEEACTSLGYERSEIINMTVPDITSMSKQVFLEHFKKVKEKGYMVFEDVHIRKDSTTFPVEINVRVVSHGKKSYIVAVARDITERKKDVEALKVSEERLRSLSRATFEGIVFNKKGVFLDCNEQFADIIGYKLGELVGIDGLTLVHPEDRELAHNRITTGNEEPYELRLLCKDGSIKFVEAHAQMMLVNGERLRVTAFRDNTERKRAEYLLRIRESQQREISEIGKFALTSETKLTELMDRIVYCIAKTLDVEYCKVLELLPDGKKLLLRAGVGWKEGCVGKATVGIEKESQSGYTLLSTSPIIVNDLRTETRFNGPKLLHDHGVISGISTIIYGMDVPYGILGAHTKKKRVFTKDDVSFVQSIANILAEAIKRKRAEELLQGQKKALEQKNIALSEILGQIEIEKKQIKDNVIANAENLLLPIVQKLRLKGESRKYVQLLRKNLQELTSSFGARLTEKRANLTTREIEICNMIKNGLTNKEISRLLNISLGTTEKHRNNIRKKLDIVNKDINLSSFLNTL